MIVFETNQDSHHIGIAFIESRINTTRYSILPHQVFFIHLFKKEANQTSKNHLNGRWLYKVQLCQPQILKWHLAKEDSLNPIS